MMKRQVWLWSAMGIWLIALSGCTINKDIMFQTPKDFSFDALSAVVPEEYRIAPNDYLDFQLYSNAGQRLLAPMAGAMEATGNVNMMRNQGQGAIAYWVRPDGMVELPEVGDMALAGLTVEEAQTALEAAYAQLYLDPYVLLRVTNNRVLVFPGDPGLARVITLQNVNTTVLEVLAMAGGISQRGNAEVVKLMRKEGEEQRVYFMDLSQIQGLAAAATTVQAGDIIYVEPVPEIATEVYQDLSPFVSLLSSVSLVWALINNFRN